MIRNTNDERRAAGLGAVRIAGASLVTAALGFMAVFSYLAVRFDYPGVLDGAAAEVLPALLALGESGRAVWTVYALLPLLLIPAAVGSAAALEENAPQAMRAARAFAVLAAVSMLMGLARWPTMHWELATAHLNAGGDARVAIEATFAGLNRYLGNFIGEFLGELSLNAFFVLSGFALVRSARTRLGYSGVAAGAIGLVAAFRNVTPVVAQVADLNNYVLPLWLIVLGVVLLRWPRSPVSAFSPAPRAIQST
jgi:hypothetical protein